MHDRVIRLEADRSFEQRQRLVGILRHAGRGDRQGSQIQVVGIKAIGSLAAGTLDLGQP